MPPIWIIGALYDPNLTIAKRCPQARQTGPICLLKRAGLRPVMLPIRVISMSAATLLLPRVSALVPSHLLDEPIAVYI